MVDLRRHGDPPWVAAVLHGGPGGSGDAAAVARELAARGYSALEPLPHGLTIAAQIGEVAAAIAVATSRPVVLNGHSWGAWLAILVAAAHPEQVTRVILVGCPPLRAGDAEAIDDSRLARLGVAARREAVELAARLAVDSLDGMGMARLGTLMEIADAVDPLPPSAEDPPVRCEPAVFRAIWREAAALRRTGELERIARGLDQPIHVIHGDHDSHPAAAVEIPLRSSGAEVDVTILKDCGHVPWREKRAHRAFFDALAGGLAPTRR